MLKIPYIGLCNIVAGEQVTPELIQQQATPANICREVNQLLDDDVYYAKTQTGLSGIRSKLGAGGGIENIARLLIKMLH